MRQNKPFRGDGGNQSDGSLSLSHGAPHSTNRGHAGTGAGAGRKRLRWATRVLADPDLDPQTGLVMGSAVIMSISAVYQLQPACAGSAQN